MFSQESGDYRLDCTMVISFSIMRHLGPVVNGSNGAGGVLSTTSKFAKILFVRNDTY